MPEVLVNVYSYHVMVGCVEDEDGFCQIQSHIEIDPRSNNLKMQYRCMCITYIYLYVLVRITKLLLATTGQQWVH